MTYPCHVAKGRILSVSNRVLKKASSGFNFLLDRIAA
jgi:hypothetical protein